MVGFYGRFMKISVIDDIRDCEDGLDLALISVCVQNYAHIDVVLNVKPIIMDVVAVW